MMGNQMTNLSFLGGNSSPCSEGMGWGRHQVPDSAQPGRAVCTAGSARPHLLPGGPEGGLAAIGPAGVTLAGGPVHPGPRPGRRGACSGSHAAEGGRQGATTELHQLQIRLPTALRNGPQHRAGGQAHLRCRGVSRSRGICLYTRRCPTGACCVPSTRRMPAPFLDQPLSQQSLCQAWLHWPEHPQLAGPLRAPGASRHAGRVFRPQN